MSTVIVYLRVNDVTINMTAEIAPTRKTAVSCSLLDYQHFNGLGLLCYKSKKKNPVH